jgi:geranylgeranyl diphosphate synthase type II
MDLKGYLQERREIINQALERLLPAKGEYPELLHDAMRYSIFAGGKRLRPILALAACEAVGGQREDALAAGCALEMIHTYSLIHDDLPAMDNDDLRRGRATSHKVFGEAMAILAGDALLTHAFWTLSTVQGKRLKTDTRLKITEEVALAAGSRGMVGGQVVDITCEGDREIDQPTLEYIHTHKTGSMIRGAVRVGAIAGGADAGQLKALTRYGDRIGLAFQITDDVLDVLGDEKALGKRVGSDIENKKKTYPGLYGISESRQRAKELVAAAAEALDEIEGGKGPLRQIAFYMVERMS